MRSRMEHAWLETAYSLWSWRHPNYIDRESGPNLCLIQLQQQVTRSNDTHVGTVAATEWDCRGDHGLTRRKPVIDRWCSLMLVPSRIACCLIMVHETGEAELTSPFLLWIPLMQRLLTHVKRLTFQTRDAHCLPVQCTATTSTSPPPSNYCTGKSDIWEKSPAAKVHPN